MRGRSSGAFLSGLVAAVMAGTLAGGAVGSPAGAGVAGMVLPAGSVASVGSTTTHLTAPADGRLRGPNFTATVTGVAWPASSGSSPDYVAGPGHRLVVFALTLTSPDLNLGGQLSGQQPTASLVVARHPEPVDLQPLDNSASGTSSADGAFTASATFVASVPAHDHDVALQLTSEGFSQALDLWTLERTGPPASTVLYRGPASNLLAASGLGTVRTITVTDTATGQASPTQVTLSSAALTPFAPGGTQPAPAGQAYLALNFQSNFVSTFGSPTYCQYIAGITPLPGSAVTFTPTGGTALPTQAEDPVSPGNQQPMSNDSGLLDAVYVATVPDDVTAGTITVAASTTTGTPYNGCEGPTSADPVQVSGPTAFPVSFPAAQAVATQPTPPWVGAPLPPTGTSTVPGGSGGTGGGFPIWLAVLLVVLVAVGVVAVQRFRRRPTAGAAQRTDPADDGGPPTDAATATTSSAEPSTATSPSSGGTGATDQAEGGATKPPDGASTDGRLVVRVLGPVRVAGWLVEPERRLVEELCCYLALHPDRPRTADQLQSALWPVESERPEATRKTLHNNMSLLRQAAGPERLPDAGAAGYQLVDVDTDWHQFRQLLVDAEGAGGPASIELRFRALELVRGEPFADVPPGRYEWAVAELLVTDMVAAVVGAAGRLSAELLAAGDVDGAERAARLGLRASPSELALWEAVAHAVVARADADGEARLWRDLTVLLGPGDVTRLRATVAAR